MTGGKAYAVAASSTASPKVANQLPLRIAHDGQTLLNFPLQGIFFYLLLQTN